MADSDARHVRRPLHKFPVRRQIQTRFADNDIFGHVNNAVYYNYFDTAINLWVESCVGRPTYEMDALGVVAESRCTFHGEVTYPQKLEVGLGISRLGNSSITYSLGLFHDLDPLIPKASAQWTHVYIDPTTRTAVPIPMRLREASESIQI